MKATHILVWHLKENIKTLFVIGPDGEFVEHDALGNRAYASQLEEHSGPLTAGDIMLGWGLQVHDQVQRPGVIKYYLIPETDKPMYYASGGNLPQSPF